MIWIILNNLNITYKLLDFQYSNSIREASGPCYIQHIFYDFADMRLTGTYFIHFFKVIVLVKRIIWVSQISEACLQLLLWINTDLYLVFMSEPKGSCRWIYASVSTIYGSNSLRPFYRQTRTYNCGQRQNKTYLDYNMKRRLQ